MIGNPWKWLCGSSVWLMLLAWAALTPLVYWLIPVSPVRTIYVEELVPGAEAGKRGGQSNHPDQAVFAALSIEKNLALTATEVERSGLWPLQVGPLRVWDLSTREKLLEVVDEDAWVSRDAFYGDWLAIHRGAYKLSARPDDDFRETVFYHILTGEKGPRIPTVNFVVSPNNRWVGYVADKGNYLLDLDSRKTHQISLPPDGKGRVKPFNIFSFSTDGELMVANDNYESIVVLKTESGEIVARFPPETNMVNLAFNPKDDAFAGNSLRGVFLRDLQGENERWYFESAFVTWHPTGALFVGLYPGRHSDITGLLCVEKWDRGSQVAKWKTPQPGGYVRASRNGRRILYTTGSQLFGWNKMQLTILDGEDLGVLDRWSISLPNRFSSADCECTLDGEKLIINRLTSIEYWAIPSHSWLRSSLWAAGVILIIAAIRAGWRSWRRRTPVPV